MRRLLVLGATVCLSTLAACASDTSGPGSSVIAVKISPDNPIVLEGAPIAFKANVVLETGELRDVTDSPSTTWLSSDPDVVQVDADGTGEATGVGSASVTARHSGITSPAQNVTVNAAPTTPPPTPTPTPAPTADHVVISEVVYDLTGSDFVEFIEVFNPTGSAVVMDGWDVVDAGGGGAPATIATFTLGAMEYAAISRDAVAFNLAYGATSEIVLNFGALNDTGDWIQLRNGADTVIDEMAYGSGIGGGTPKPAGWCATNAPASGDAQSVARNPDGSDGDTCDDWVGGQTPSPDDANP